MMRKISEENNSLIEFNCLCEKIDSEWWWRDANDIESIARMVFHKHQLKKKNPLSHHKNSIQFSYSIYANSARRPSDCW